MELLRMLNIQTETLISFRDLPSWCKQHLGRRISPSSLHRWRLRGCRGVKLETLLIGGSRTTSEEALQRFFEATTRVQDGENPPSQSASDDCAGGRVTAAHNESVAYLKSEGI